MQKNGLNKNGFSPQKNHSKPTLLNPSFKNTVRTQTKTTKPVFFIVGVGASAGGLEAFTELLKEIPANAKMAFVLVQHLAPTHGSILTELLSKASHLPVSEVLNNTVVQPGRVYVIPPNTEMVIVNGVLRLSDRKDIQGRNVSIDAFFRSLAADQKECAIGVILSGSESDGVLGLENIKAEGGFTFAQDEASAKFKDMPRKAADSGVVDFVLRPKAIAAKLSHLPSRLSTPHFKPTEKEEPAPKDAKAIVKILDHLKIKTGMDFAFYKPSTVFRRITRRMTLQRLDDLGDYFSYLRKNVHETQELRKDLLINVTSFFRDPNSFEFLKKKILPEIMKRKAKDGSIRIWVPGCSTGNEAYSIAICLDEFLKGKRIPIQIFATDVSATAVDSARRGIYPENIKLDVSAQRLERYFQRTDGGYQIKRSIRDLCVFAPHNMISDPPFLDIDLVSCRNVLIYMEPQLQKKAISFFHYSLKPLGYLMLGSSESVGEFSDYFSPMDKKQKVYIKKKSLKNGHRLQFPLAGPEKKSRAFVRNDRFEGVKVTSFDARKEASRILAGTDSKDGVLITEGMEIIEFYGHTQPYIRPAAGQASFSLLQMVHESLLPDLCIAIYKAKKEKHPVVKISLAHGDSKFVNIEVVPVYAPEAEEFYFLVLLKQSAKQVRLGIRADTGRILKENKDFKQELTLAKESLLSLIREQSGLAEELRSQNEEMQSSNEEFQSTNEELETAKEELQSANEELITVNNEMEVRNSELIQTNDDLTNLIVSIHTSIILVDGNLKIRRFTAHAGKNIGIVNADIGRKIMDIGLSPRVDNLEGFIREVIESLEQKEREVDDINGHCYLMRARPYRKQDGKIDGAVLMFVDITDIKRSIAQIQAAKKYSETIVETLWEPLVALDANLHIKSANKAFYDFFQVSQNETIGRLIYDLGNGQWNIPRLKELLEELISQSNSFYNLEIEHDFPKIGTKLILLNAHKVALKDNQKEEVIILAFQDISEQRHAEESLNKIAAELSYSNKELDNFASTAAHDLRSPLNKIQLFAERLLGESISEKGKAYLETMIQSSRRMGGLVENLLKVSRVTSQGHEVERVLLDEVVAEVISDLELTIQQSGAIIEKTMLPVLTANRVQMHQLFQNLIENAIKYRKTNEPPHIVITSQIKKDAVEITVKDNGIGFEEKYSHEIFKPFRRLQGSSDDDGSGIGLTLCQKILRHHGGEILVTSRPGDGAAFILRWPKKALSYKDSV